MLKINPDPTFESEVQVTVPGQKEPGTMKLTFKYRSGKEYSEWYKGMEEVKEGKKVVKEGKKTTEALPEFVVGWDLPEEFNQSNIDTFLDNYPMAYRDIHSHYLKALFTSRVKN
jgi:hypothetical protein